MTFVKVGIQWERVRTYISTVAGSLCMFLHNCRRTYTGELTGLLEWPAGLSFSLKFQTLYCLSTPTRKYEHASSPTYFMFMAGYQNLHTSVFFSGNLLILSVTLFTYNKLHSSPSSFIFLFPTKLHYWCYFVTALNLLSSFTALCHQLSRYITVIYYA